MSDESDRPRFDDITIFETEDGKTRVKVRFEHENVWLTQKLMAQLYECSSDNIGLHLRNIFAERELDEKSVTEESSVTAADGKNYRTNLYSLEAIIAVGYRVQSPRATQFRTWATNRLKDYILKGFAIDKGKVSHAVALALAEKHYEKFRGEQDRHYQSDFDRVIKTISETKLTAKKNG